MSIPQNFPNTRPSLNLNFARSQKLDPRITFTRTSSATRVNSDGLIEVVPANSPRFDFDPVSGECLGLLIEEQRTNLLLQSEEFDNASWVKTNATVATNSAASPAGTTTADTLVENAGGGAKIAAQSVSFTTGLNYCASVYVKAAGRTQARLSLGVAAFSAGPRMDVDLSTGVVTSSGAVSASAQSVGDGWWRLILVGLSTASTTASVAISPLLSGVASYTGDGTSGLFLWGAQLEAGSFPTSYIPTAATTATRTADNANIIGSDVESWYRQDEGTFISDSRILQSGVQTQGVWSIGDGTNQISLRSPQVTADRFRGNIGNVFTSAPGTGNILLNTFRAAISYNSTIGRLQVGTASTEVTPSQLPVNPNTFGIGNLGGGSAPLNGIIKWIVYYPIKLNNNILETFTK